MVCSVGLSFCCLLVVLVLLVYDRFLVVTKNRRCVNVELTSNIVATKPDGILTIAPNFTLFVFDVSFFISRTCCLFKDLS